MDIVERLRMTPETGADPDLIFAAVEEIEMLRANVLAEREACAKLVEEFPHWLGNTGRREIATALRLRSNARDEGCASIPLDQPVLPNI